jgi:SulP family sulfate permease
MIITILAYPLLNFIPVAALVGLMMIVVIRTFKWFSLKMFIAAVLPQSIRDQYNLKMKVPRYEAFAILATTVLANVPKGTNLAYAVLAGVIISALGYSWRSGQLFEINQSMEGDTKRYDVNGPLFFASANRLSKVLNPNFDADNVLLVFGHSTVIDYTALDVLNKVSQAYREKNKNITFQGLDPESMKCIEKAAGHFGSIKPEDPGVHFGSIKPEDIDFVPANQAAMGPGSISTDKGTHASAYDDDAGTNKSTGCLCPRFW